MKKFVLILCILCILLTYMRISFADDIEYNITSFAKVTSSTDYPGMPKENAVDGNSSTSWTNAYYPNGGNFLRLDFPFPIKISKINLLMYNGSGYNRNFEVRLSASDPFTEYDLIYDSPDATVGQQVFTQTDDKKYTTVLVISKGINGMLGISEIEVYSDINLIGYCDIAQNKAVSGGNNSRNLSPNALVDGDEKTYAAMEDGSVLDIDLGNKFDLSLLKIVSASTDGNRKNIHIIGSDSKDFESGSGTGVICDIEDALNPSEPFYQEISGRYRFIRIYSDSQDFTPLSELSIYAYATENIQRWIITDSEGNEIDDIYGKELNSISVNISKSSRSSYLMIVMLYDERGHLENASLASGKEGEILADISGFGVFRKGCKLNAILIDNYSKRNAICAPLVKE